MTSTGARRRSSARPGAQPGARACRDRRRVAQPLARAAASSGVSSGWYTRSATTAPGGGVDRHRAPSPPSRPASRSRRDRRVAAIASRSRPTPPVCVGERGRGRGGVGAAGRNPHVGAGAAQGERNGAGGAAGAEQQHLFGPRDRGRVGANARTKPSPSVESPRSRPSRHRGDGVDAPQHGGVGAQFVARGGDRFLVRHRDRQPDEPEGAHSVERSALRRPARRTRRRPSRDRAPCTRRCATTGESECRTGSPITPATLVVAEINQAPRCAARDIDVVLVLLERARERVVALLVDHARSRGSRSARASSPPAATPRSPPRSASAAARCGRTCCTAS